MWLEIANTDRTVFIDRSVAVSGSYSYRIVAKFLKVTNILSLILINFFQKRGKPSDATAEIQLEPCELRRSSSFSIADRTPSPTLSIGDIHTRRQSLDDSGISGAETAPPTNGVKAEIPDASKKGTRVVKKKKKQPETLPPKPTLQINILEALRDQNVDEGSDATFKCRFEGTSDQTSVIWLVF
jgi:hypothetical protein